MRDKISLQRRVSECLTNLVTEDRAHIDVACSGGPDSTALLHVLAELRSFLNLKLSCAYFDHGIRKPNEADGDIDFLKQITTALGISLTVERQPFGELKRIAGRTRRSLEEVARNYRYRYLTSIAAKISADYIATGHSLSDHVETILMRLFQGASYYGLSGIPPIRDKIIRPLLFSTREEVLGYLTTHGLVYRTDKTNLSKEFLRNRIRHELIPVIQKVFPDYEKTLPLFAEKMRGFMGFVKEEVRSRAKWEKVEEISGTAFRINGTRFVSLPGVIRLYSFYQTFDQLARLDPSIAGPNGGQIPYRFVSPLLDDSWFYPKRRLLTGHNVTLDWRGQFLFLERKVVSKYKKGYLIVVNYGARSVIRGSDLEIIATDVNPINDLTNQLIINRDDIQDPLVVRSKRPGDKIELGMGLKSLKKLFNEWQVPRDTRWSVPVIADRNGILAVLGDCLGFKNRYSRRANNWQSTQSGGQANTSIIRVKKAGLR